MNHFLLFFRFFLLELLRLGVAGDFECDLDLFDLCFRLDLELSLSSDEPACKRDSLSDPSCLIMFTFIIFNAYSVVLVTNYEPYIQSASTKHNLVLK